ncbi:transposase [Methanobrevibacter arboriphilus]|uniref:transposase n=1 Tax=Methanobrevibacter arboriphilus TaxID=39441 RepID=UPI001CDA8E95
MGEITGKKTVRRLQKLYNKIFNIRNDEYQKLSTEIIKSFDLIGLENLGVKSMIKKPQIKSQYQSNIMVKTY